MKLDRTFLTVALLGLLHACHPGGTNDRETEADLSFAIPEALGFLPDSLHQVDSLLQEYTDRQWIPGAVALVARNGKIIYETTAGFQDPDEGIPLERDHIFRLASMTKPVTAVAVMQLVERGEIKLSDSLARYIPEFSAPVVLTAFNPADTTWEARPASRGITIHDLLTHTSGIGYGFTDPRMAAIYGSRQIPDMATPQAMTLEEKMARLGGLPLVHDPGEKHTYGLSSDVLGRVIEVASGMPLDEYISRNILLPLGMNSTHFYLPDEQKPRLVKACISGSDSTILPIGELGGEMYHPSYPVSGAMSYLSGGSGLNGTTRDYFRFCQALLDGGMGLSSRILNDTTVSMMLSGQLGKIPYWPGKTIGYGFEIITDPNPAMGQLPGRYSWFGAFQTMCWVDPERGVVGILLSQVMFSPLVFDFFADFERLVNNAILPAEQVQRAVTLTGVAREPTP